LSRFAFLLRLPVIVGLAHFYVALRLAPALEDRAGQWALAAGIVLLYLLIMMGFKTRRAAGRPAGDMAAWAGFLALGYFAWLFVLTLCRDLLLGSVAVGRLTGLPPPRPPAEWPLPADMPDQLRAAASLLYANLPAYSAYTVLLLALLAVLLGLYNSRRVARIVRVDVPLPGLPDALEGCTIAQLSDIHVGPTIKRGYVRRIVNRTNALRPDIIAITGDLIDGSVERLRDDVAPLAGLQARHGVFAVTGNHEYYSGADAWVAEFRRIGLDVLMNEHRILAHDGATLVLAGVTDFGAAAFDRRQASDPETALRGSPEDVGARILLAHQPRSAPAAARAGFDLQLSGHTHGGQFWPWRYFVPLQQPFVSGLHDQDGMAVYVSQGTGYWGPPMRIGAKSEITLIRLVRA